VQIEVCSLRFPEQTAQHQRTLDISLKEALCQIWRIMRRTGDRNENMLLKGKDGPNTVLSGTENKTTNILI